jgi:hypothetical protein
VTTIPRGVALNNPLNIEREGIPWVGLSPDQPDSVFCKFLSVEYGFRAAFKNLRTYQLHDNVNTIRALVSRWAPPEDHNDTDGYIAAVAHRCGLDPDGAVDLTAWVDTHLIVHAMTIQEQGSFDQFFTGAQLRDGALLAGVTGVPHSDT